MTLPLMDEHRATIAAPGPAAWAEVRRFAASLADSDHAVLGRILGTVPSSGFSLDEEHPGHEVALSGRHRFARYRLVFALEPSAEGSTSLAIRSYAAFPGLRGRAYRAMLIGSRGHVLAVRHMIRTIKARTE